MIVALHHDKSIGCHILATDIPRLASAFTATADAQSLALTKRVIHQTGMAADSVSVQNDHVTGVARQIPVQEFTERPFADKADSGWVFFVVIRKFQSGGELSHFALV